MYGDRACTHESYITRLTNLEIWQNNACVRELVPHALNEIISVVYIRVKVDSKFILHHKICCGAKVRWTFNIISYCPDIEI